MVLRLVRLRKNILDGIGGRFIMCKYKKNIKNDEKGLFDNFRLATKGKRTRKEFIVPNLK